MDTLLSTLVFTDIADSSHLWETAPNAMRAALDLHDATLRTLVPTHGGTEVRTEGDAFLLSFPDGNRAVEYCLAVQSALSAVAWPQQLPEAQGLRVRMGISTGRVGWRTDPHTGHRAPIGIGVHRTDAIASAAAGGQILVDAPTAADTHRPLQTIGAVRLANLAEPVTLHEVTIAGRAFEPPGVLHGPNLPKPRTAFVGRHADLARLYAALQAGSATLVGPAGVGKTRLALEVARTVARREGRDVIWVPLADATSETDILARLAHAVLGSASGRDANELLAVTMRALATGTRPLVVLDDLENIAERVRAIVQQLTRHDSDLRVLSTSRVPIRYAGETVVPVDPLPPAEAVALFMARMREHGIEMLTTGSVQGHIGRIVDTVDGLPLAVELAAARLRDVSLDDLARQLDNSLRALDDEAGQPNSLDAAIGLSWKMLNASSRRLLTELSVFRGSFNLDAAEQVAETEGSVIDDMEGLVHASLVSPLASADGEMRFLLLSSVHSFVARRGPPAESTLRRHADWADRLMQRHPVGSRAMIRTLTDERDNLHAAWTWALSRDARLALRLTLARDYLIRRTGTLQELQDLVDQTHEHAKLGTPGEQARWYRCSGHTHRRAGRVEDALERYAVARRISTEAGDADELAHTLIAEGIAHRVQGQFAKAEAEFKQAAPLFAQAGDPGSEGLVAGNLGILYKRTQRYAEARRWLQRAFELFDAAGRTDDAQQARQALGTLCLDIGDLQQAEELFVDVLGRVGDEDDQLYLPTLLGDLGALYLELGDLDKAAAFLERSTRVFRLRGDAAQLAVTDWNMALLLFRRGERADALLRYERVVQALAAAESWASLGLASLVYAHLLALSGQTDRAREVRAGMPHQCAPEQWTAVEAVLDATLRLVEHWPGEEAFDRTIDDLDAINAAHPSGEARLCLQLLRDQYDSAQPARSVV